MSVEWVEDSIATDALVASDGIADCEVFGAKKTPSVATFRIATWHGILSTNER